jgi:hypothetical protein
MRRSYTKIKYFVLTGFSGENSKREKSKREKYCPKDFDNLKNFSK